MDRHTGTDGGTDRQKKGRQTEMTDSWSLCAKLLMQAAWKVSWVKGFIRMATYIVHTLCFQRAAMRHQGSHTSHYFRPTTAYCRKILWVRLLNNNYCGLTMSKPGITVVPLSSFSTFIFIITVLQFCITQV